MARNCLALFCTVANPEEPETNESLSGHFTYRSYKPGAWLISLAQSSAVERETLSLLRTLFAIPDSFEGAFVSGATQANVVASAIARQCAAQKLG